MTWLLQFVNEILFGIIYIVVALIGALIICWPITIIAIIYFISCDVSGTWVEGSKRGAYPKMSWENK